MKAFLFIMVVLMVLFLVVVFVMAWQYDRKNEKFRAALEPDMLVAYSEGYELKNAVIKEVLADLVLLTDCKTQKRYYVPKTKVYER